MRALGTGGSALRSALGFVSVLLGRVHKLLQGPAGQPAVARILWGLVRFIIYWLLVPTLALIAISLAGGGLGFWKLNPDAFRRTATACVNQMTGSIWQMESAVKETLRDPASFEHIESAGTKPDADGDIAVRMTYRARNGFGGLNVETAHAVIHKDCSVSLTRGLGR